MNWKVDYAQGAIQDLQDIYAYISNILLEPITAKKQVIRIMESAESLDHMPFRYRLYDKGAWADLGIRILPIDNYPKLIQGLIDLMIASKNLALKRWTT